MTFCHSIYVKKVMKLLAFIFEQPSYRYIHVCASASDPVLVVANKKGTDQPAHPRSLISAFVNRLLQSIISRCPTSENFII